jgi:hypothetical protein
VRHPFAGLPETDGHPRHVDVAELVDVRGHIRADASDMLGEIKTEHGEKIPNLKSEISNKFQMQNSKTQKGHAPENFGHSAFGNLDLFEN